MKKKEFEEIKIIYLRSLIFRTMYAVIIFLVISILSKRFPTTREFIYNNIYGENLSFTSFSASLKSVLGDILPFDFNGGTKQVFGEKIKYKSIKTYKDGVLLEVDPNYLVHSQNSGIVVFVGERKDYGKTVIVQQVDGISMWYGNITNLSVNVYDYVEEGAILGEVNGTNLYILCEKAGTFIDPRDILK